MIYRIVSYIDTTGNMTATGGSSTSTFSVYYSDERSTDTSTAGKGWDSNPEIGFLTYTGDNTRRELGEGIDLLIAKLRIYREHVNRSKEGILAARYHHDNYKPKKRYNNQRKWLKKGRKEVFFFGRSSPAVKGNGNVKANVRNAQRRSC